MIKNSQPFGKKFQKTVGGDFFWLTLYIGGGGQVERRKRECRGAAGAEQGTCPPPHIGRVCGSQPEIFLHFHVEMAYFGGILAVNFKFYSMNNTPKSNGYERIQRDKKWQTVR